ncbi:unnamed protein product [Calypogeia fissa]
MCVYFWRNARSRGTAYGAMKGLLQRLMSSETRVEARVFLNRVENYVNAELLNADTLAEFHFRIHELTLTDFQGIRDNRQKLKLLELPSIFIPEDWSFTFLEGLNRHPDSGFQDRDVVELGCGNGWISIALAERWSPKKVYGLDINPRAIKVAQINLYLNALNGDGSPIFDHEGKTLLDRVEFHESDLLGYCRDRNIMLDRIVGCIPQVLTPNPEAMASIVSENAGEEFLYSLSNYCGLQGFVEDQFGLGLVARAAEEGIALLRANGAMIFNMGGRPGQAVCERLFERRGFHINKLWQTRVIQAADTDILALVEIEKNSPHRFEFFMGRVGEEPINARTAYTFAKAGGEIAHGLSVYECRLRQPTQVKTIFKFLSDGWEQTRSALDLSFQAEAVADEKIPFLAHLARTLHGIDHFPLELATGSSLFGNLISSFMRNYHRIPLTPESVTILPSRSIVIENVLRLFSPHLALVDANLTRSLPKKWTASLPDQGNMKAITEDNVTVIEAPQRTDLVTQLVKRLQPKIVITGIAAFELQTSTAFEQLLEASAEVGARLFVDISDHVELSSVPGTNGVLQYMASHALPIHVAIICGLVKNQVYADLEVAFVISENQRLLNALAKTSELTCGRTAISSQFYYGCLLHELLSFQLPDRHTTLQRLPVPEGEHSQFISFSGHAISAVAETELSCSDLENTKLVNLHYEENTLQIPSVVKVSIFEGFGRQNITSAEMDPKPDILKFLKTKYGLKSEELVLSNSSVALFSKVVLACVEDRGTLCFPTGSNGTYVSAAKFLGANVEELRTDIKDRFKLTADVADSFLQTVHKPWLYISGPTIFPTGLIYSQNDISSILAVCKKHGARLIIDTASSGLEYETPFPWNLEDLMTADGTGACAVALLGGFSQELLTGGIECAFAAFSDPVYIEAFKDAPTLNKPHGTLKYSIKKLLHKLEEKSGDLVDGLTLQKKILKERAEGLQRALVDCGWQAIMPCGGTSLVAEPSTYVGKVVSYVDSSNATKEVVLGSTNIGDVLFKTTGLCISSSAWTGIRGYYRFVISCKEDDFQKALGCLQSFKKLVHDH